MSLIFSYVTTSSARTVAQNERVEETLNTCFQIATGLVGSSFFVTKASSCSIAGCGPLQVLQAFLFRQSL